MDKRPLVSICIPTYNSGKTIIETLESVMKQTYSNIEIVICDNNSTDDTLIKIMGFKGRIAIKIKKNKINIGPAANTNKTIRMAKGIYICVWHADDIYHPKIITKQVNIMRMYPNCGAVFALRKIINEKGEIINKIPLPFKTSMIYLYESKEYFFPKMLEYGNFFVCPTAMVRKTVYDKVGLYKVGTEFNSKEFTNESQMVVDQDMWLRIMDKYKVAVLNTYLINYRMHMKQGSMVLNKRRKTLSPEYDLYDEYIKRWKYNNVQGIKDYNKMKSRAYLFYAINSLLNKDEELFEDNIILSYFHQWFLLFPFNVIRWALNTLPHFLMRIIILTTVKLLKIMRLNRKYLFINYI